MATGLMVICVGEGTKLVPYLTADDKSYEAEVTFGVATDSYDAEGEVTQRDDLAMLTPLHLSQVEEALSSFLGMQEQTPPAFSAIRVNGERLYEKARRGEVVEVPTRTVTFHTLELLDFLPATTETPLPKARLRVKCSKGTYIRSLAADLGARLGVSAHLTMLRRTAAGSFKIADASPVESVTSETLDDQLLSLVEALPHVPLISLSPEETHEIRLGRSLPLPQSFTATDDLSLCRGQSPAGELIALLTLRDDRLKVLRGFNCQV